MSESLTATLVKAARIREYVAGYPGCALKDITTDLSFNKATAYRLLTTLVQLKWLTKQAGRYYLRTKQRERQFQTVGWLAKQVVQPLVDARHLTAFLGMRYNGALVISQVFASADRLSDFALLGEQQSLNASALGKCLLAFDPQHHFTNDKVARGDKELPDRPPRPVVQPGSHSQSGVCPG